MRLVTYSMGISLDGFITDPDGAFDWAVPGEESFRISTEEVRNASVHLMGRRLYETMLYWQTADEDDELGFSTAEFAPLWRALPKVVFSRTLTAVQGNARLATRGLAEEIELLRAEPGEGEIAIGGADLAAAAAELGLIDEYRMMVYPVLLGGGAPFFARIERQVDLELLESRAIDDGTLALRYRVKR